MTRIATDDFANGSVTTPTAGGPPMRVDAHFHRGRYIASYLELPFIHKWLIVTCTLLGMFCGWLAILLWPRSYESTAKLMIRVGRESVSLDPTATTSATLLLQKTLEEEVISALDVLNSRQVAETVVDKLGPDSILNGVAPVGSPESSPEGSSTDALKEFIDRAFFSVLKTAGIKDDVSDRELAVLKLQDSLSIHSPRKSNVIVVSATSKSPEMAQAIVREVTSSFQEEHLKVAHTHGSRDFFEKQSAEAEQRLDKLIASRSQFMQRHNIVSIEANRLLLQQRFTEVDRDLSLANGDLKQAMSEIGDLQAKVAATDEEIVATKTQASDVTWSGMRQRIYDLELEEQEFSAKYTDSHPKLQQVRERLSGARAILTKLKSERVDESRTPNPMIVRLREDLQKQETRVVGLRASIEQKQAQRAELTVQANQLLDHERELTQADRNIRLLEDSVQTLREKLEEARVSDELYTRRISNAHVFQPATLVERAASPNKPMLAVGFAILGMCTGLGLSGLRQASSPFLRTREDVESELGVRVVSTLPELPRMDAQRLGNQKLFRETCQTLISELVFGRGRPRSNRGITLGVLGVDVGAGASTLAAHLAACGRAECQVRTVVVDADSRARSLSRMFGLNGRPGLVELVNGSASHDECLQRVPSAAIELVAAAANSCPDTLTAGPAEIAQAMQAYLRDCDLLIVDLPAASQPDQTVALARELDYVLVVMESEKTDSSAAEHVLRRLMDSETTVVGVVLNKTRSYLPSLVQKFVTPRN